MTHGERRIQAVERESVRGSATVTRSRTGGLGMFGCECGAYVATQRTMTRTYDHASDCYHNASVDGSAGGSRSRRKGGSVSGSAAGVGTFGSARGFVLAYPATSVAAQHRPDASSDQCLVTIRRGL